MRIMRWARSSFLGALDIKYRFVGCSADLPNHRHRVPTAGSTGPRRRSIARRAAPPTSATPRRPRTAPPWTGGSGALGRRRARGQHARSTETVLRTSQEGGLVVPAADDGREQAEGGGIGPFRRFFLTGKHVGLKLIRRNANATSARSPSAAPPPAASIKHARTEQRVPHSARSAACRPTLAPTRHILCCQSRCCHGGGR